jgi:hypothetical protein
MWRRICRWVDDKHEIDNDFAAYVAVEKGLREGGLHLQCVVDMLATSPLLINRRVRAAIGLDDDGVDGKVMAKTLIVTLLVLGAPLAWFEMIERFLEKQTTKLIAKINCRRKTSN